MWDEVTPEVGCQNIAKGASAACYALLHYCAAGVSPSHWLADIMAALYGYDGSGQAARGNIRRPWYGKVLFQMTFPRIRQAYGLYNILQIPALT